jgi:hypothetical protein
MFSWWKKNIYILCVPHKNNCKKKVGSHDRKQTDSSIIIVRNVCVLTSASMIFYLFFMRSWSAIIGPKLFFTRLWSAIIGTKQPKVNQSPTEYIYFFFINWTLRMSDNLPERVQILCHAHIICITVLENRIICCQIFCDLLLKSAFERIFNVMQLILVKIRWHIKWKYLIKKFHDICLSYYFNTIISLDMLIKYFGSGQFLLVISFIANNFFFYELPPSKADFKSKSQNIWQQIILFSSTVMQMICVWHKIWTLSGRLSLMRNVQLMK